MSNSTAARRGVPVVLSGPSGVGKNTVLEALLARVPGVAYCISTTSRPPRGEERDGVDYHFLSREAFEAAIAAAEFAEWAEVHGALYGTHKATLEAHLSAGDDVLLQKDVQGGLALGQVYPDALLVYLLPPSMEELRRRLEGRHTDAEDVIQRRLEKAAWENEQARGYTHLVINDDLDECIATVEHIVLANRQRRVRMLPELVKRELVRGE